jgi:hypothetical protein
MTALKKDYEINFLLSFSGLKEQKIPLPKPWKRDIFFCVVRGLFVKSFLNPHELRSRSLFAGHAEISIMWVPD